MSAATAHAIDKVVGNVADYMAEHKVSNFADVPVAYFFEGIAKEIAVNYPEARVGSHFALDSIGGAPVFGLSYWKRIRKRLREAVCGDDRLYSEDLKDIRSEARTLLVILVPAVLAALSLPASAAGLAAVLSLFILKIGMRAFCADDEAPQMSEALQFYLRLLRDPSRREEAIRCLALLADVRSLQPLLDQLRTEQDWTIKSLSIIALLKLGDKQAINPLKVLAMIALSTCRLDNLQLLLPHGSTASRSQPSCRCCWMITRICSFGKRFCKQSPIVALPR